MLNANEQLFLELLNAARLDPSGEASRQGIDLNAGLAPGTIDTRPVQPLAPNAQLQQAAADHGRWILDTDTFSHTGEGGSSPGDRMAAAGYPFGGRPFWGENLALLGSTGALDLTAVIDPGIGGFKGHFDGLYESEGHRVVMFAADFRETGVSQAVGRFRFPEGNFDSSMLTNTFATPREGVFLTGVIYDDAGSDGYTVRDGRGNFEISAGGTTTASWEAGGYTLKLPGDPSVGVTLGSGAGAMQVFVDLSGGNVKLDLLDGTRILTSGDLVLGSGAREVGMIGAVNNSVTGNTLDNVFHVGRGDNVIEGGGGADRAVFTGARSDFAIVEVSPGQFSDADQRDGPASDGANTLTNVAFAEFSDETVSLQTDATGTRLSGTLGTPDGTTVADTALRFTLSDASEQIITTDAAGAFALVLPTGMTGRLDMAPGAGNPGALDVGDALDILRLAVGLEPSFGPATPHDLIAADVDRSGRVAVDDALDVLRVAVGLTVQDASPGDHVMLDPAGSLAGLDARSVSYTSGVDLDHSLAGGTLDLQMVTLGDLGAVNAV